jgi:hypothetical protein
MDEHLKLPHKTDLDAASVVKSGTMVALQRLEEDQPAGSLTTSHPDVTDSFAERGPEMAGMSRVEELLALPASEANPPIQAATEVGPLVCPPHSSNYMPIFLHFPFCSSRIMEMWHDTGPDS